MRVVGFIGLRHHAVGKRGIDWRGRKRRAYDRDRAIATMFTNIALSGLTRGQFRSGNHGRDGIKQMKFGLFDDVLGQRPGSRRAHVAAERVHDAPGAGALRVRTNRR
jgi:hypothetical protein